ncbi:Auxin-responsive protein IAA26 [Forsythia ovata]|uniref:Auxin-responsive protein n=1 Tax=Forsythia ovata TaxID=205694 RepID=A0ABD1WZS7_9LAMI
MDGYSEKEEGCPKLLDLIPKEKSKLWHVKGAEEEEEDANHGITEEKKLELRLGPPDTSHVYQSPWKQQTKTSVIKDSSQPCSFREMVELKSAERKGFSEVPANTAQKRIAPPVAGWPPIRSFRKNLASSSCCKLALESQNLKLHENLPKNNYVKINMDGVPIGRKVDLNAYDNYQKLSSAVDELFRSLLAAQCNSSAVGNGIKNIEGGEVITGLLDGSGEYTLVYEDNKGDRMLVGDVPWHIFVSTVKRLRVMKSSELATLSGGSKQGRLSLDAQLK